MLTLTCISDSEKVSSDTVDKHNVRDWLSDSLANNLFYTTSKNLFDDTKCNTRELNNRVEYALGPLKLMENKVDWSTVYKSLYATKVDISAKKSGYALTQHDNIRVNRG